MIRRAGLEDVEFAVSLCEEIYPATHWAGLADFDRDRVRSTIIHLVQRDDAAVFLSRRGLIVVIVVPHWFADLNTVQELFFWALDGSGDRLRREAETWARGLGAAVPIVMGAHEPGDMEKTERWYRRAGYEPHGRTYRKVLTNGH